MQKIFVYLASRNKKGIKLVTELKGNSMVTSRLTDLKILKLPLVWENQIQQIINDNRMLFEPWIESANSYNELRERLKSRGYLDLPMGANPALNFANHASAPLADTSNCDVRRTMLRKKGN